MIFQHLPHHVSNPQPGLYIVSFLGSEAIASTQIQLYHLLSRAYRQKTLGLHSGQDHMKQLFVIAISPDTHIYTQAHHVFKKL